MKAYITKYALAKGIMECDGTIVDGSSTNMIEVNHGTGFFSSTYYHGDDWHRDREAAVVQAEKMRIKRIHALKKQIAKLEAMKFE